MILTCVGRADAVRAQNLTPDTLDSSEWQRIHRPIEFSVEDPAEIVATDNGDPTSLESFHSSRRAAFNRLCLVILRGKPGVAGRVTLRADSPQLQRAILTLNTVR
jgi:hypothetical protein